MNELQLQQLDDCLDCEEGLSNWEIGFIESLEKSFRKRELSLKQEDILQRIVDKL